VITYKGERQKGAFHCVFASVGPAVNSVSGKDIWTQDALLEEWRKQGIPDVNLHFRNIHPIAIRPVKVDVKAKHHEDGLTPISDTDAPNRLPLIRQNTDVIRSS
jgi:hypothetical protein